MAPQRRPDGADTCAPGALLFPELFARAADLALILGLVRTRAPPRQIMPHCFVQQILVYFGAEYIVGKIDLANLFAFEIFNVRYWHGLLFTGPFWPCE